MTKTLNALNKRGNIHTYIYIYIVPGNSNGTLRGREAGSSNNGPLVCSAISADMTGSIDHMPMCRTGARLALHCVCVLLTLRPDVLSFCFLHFLCFFVVLSFFLVFLHCVDDFCMFVVFFCGIVLCLLRIFSYFSLLFVIF